MQCPICGAPRANGRITCGKTRCINGVFKITGADIAVKDGLTANSWPVRHPNGSLVKAGDLTPGLAYHIDEHGILTPTGEKR